MVVVEAVVDWSFDFYSIQWAELAGLSVVADDSPVGEVQNVQGLLPSEVEVVLFPEEVGSDL